MKYPMIGKQPRREVSISQLSGGLNLRDSVTGIRDNQLTDCENMWYKEGMLRTRPPFLTDGKSVNLYEISGTDENAHTRFHSEIKIFYGGLNCICATNKRVITDENGNKSCNIGFEFQAADRSFVMPEIQGIDGGEEINYFCTEMSGVLYCYISDFSIRKLEYGKNRDENPLAWENVDIDNAYVPTVYVHCQRTGWDDFKGTLFEGYNLIGKSYKMIYSAYNVADSENNHPMRYRLGQKLADSGSVTVEITSYDSANDKTITVTHKIEYTADEGNSVKNGDIIIEKFADGKAPEDGLYLFMRYNYVGFLFTTEEPYFVGLLDTEEKVKKYGCNEDNIIITAQYKIPESNLKKVFCMTRSTWFGGLSNGINDGSRLFICGNTDEDNKSLILWSGLNEPLYFSENCYAYVGSKSRAVTAFGKQGENLIVFKENKIYCSAYKQSSGVDADDLIGQSVIDYSANSIYFPMIQVNAFIGCDCPDTVQMCRNRLVWASSDGRVYTLCNVSQYNEHTVYDISEMVAPKLKEYKNRLKYATSADFDGHYILFLGDCAFAADYCCYGYQYISSYSKSDDANTLIPWYYWDFSFLHSEQPNGKAESAAVCVLDGEMLMRAHFNYADENKAAFVGFKMSGEKCGGSDCEPLYDPNDGLVKAENRIIKNRAATKLFELGMGINSISVDRVSIKIGSVDGSDVVAKFITEQGEEEIVINNRHEYKPLTSPNFIRSKNIRPCIRAILKFGLKIECEGQLCIDGLSIGYRLLGGSK